MQYAMIWHHTWHHDIIWHDDEYDDEYDEEYVDGDNKAMMITLQLSKPVQELGAFPSGSLAQADEDKEAKKAGRKSPFCEPFLSQFSARQRGVVLILSRSL